ncbi:accessory Sec system protein Asp2 [Staphylococcus equorum]|uniref:accessory Sec system protein Asp2 n=1 Tax=Staphylococcus equorum TaxID=246432 RepID=UPI003F55EC18
MDTDIIYNIKDKIKFDGSKRILIDTGSKSNYIEMVRKNPDLHEKYKTLLKNDYILYFHQDTISKFYKREYVNELFQRKDLKKYNNVFYTIDEPIGRKLNNKVEKKLLVIFTCMPNIKEYDSSLMPKRMFPKFFDGIERSLVKNVYTMRIMDLNVSHGSHYISTSNYPEYEEDIQEAIVNAKNQLGIKDENIVLYGGSKGGTGAIYHGAALDYKTLAVDPIVNIGGSLAQKDRRFMKGLRKEDLIPSIDFNLRKSNKYKKNVICCENVKLYFEQTNRIDDNLINKIKLEDDSIVNHPDVSRNSVPEQLMILNELLLNKS